MMKPLLLKADVLHKLGELDKCKAVYEIVLLMDPHNEKARKSVERIERLQQRSYSIHLGPKSLIDITVLLMLEKYVR